MCMQSDSSLFLLRLVTMVTNTKLELILGDTFAHGSGGRYTTSQHGQQVVGVVCTRPLLVRKDLQITAVSL